MKTTTEYEELKAAGLSDQNIMMLRNIGASHRSILAFAKKLAAASTLRARDRAILGK